jgi:hypothetical protein
VSGATHKLKRRLESAPAEVLMLRQLAAATGRIVAWIVGAGIIVVLLLCSRKNIPHGPVRFHHEPRRQDRAAQAPNLERYFPEFFPWRQDRYVGLERFG